MHLAKDKKIPWELRDFAYKMIKCGLIDDDFLDWGKPFTKGIDKIERAKDLPNIKGGNGVKALCKGLGHNIEKLLKVPDYSFNTVRYTPFKPTPDLNRKMMMKYSKGPVNVEKLKPITTNLELLDESV